MEVGLSPLFEGQRVQIRDASSAGEGRRAASRLAARVGLGETRTGELEIIVTEAARNTAIHANGGQLILSGVRQSGYVYVDMYALDSGKGIRNITQAMEDGYSTGGTAGQGLGAIRRMATKFDLLTSPQGTVLYARVGDNSPSRSKVDIAGISVPIESETVCGDQWGFIENGTRLKLVVADGLGHGKDAADAATEAVATFMRYASDSPVEVLKHVHDALRKTRGGAVSVAEIDLLAHTLTFSGLGNVSGVVIRKGTSRSLVSHNGTVGHLAANFQQFTEEFPPEAVFVMHSDGIQTRWDLSRHSGLAAKRAGVIAGMLFRDFRRERDDSTVVVVKHAKQEMM